MNIQLTSREVTAVRNVLNGHKHCDGNAEKTAKMKFERLVQDEAAKIVRRVVHGK